MSQFEVEFHTILNCISYKDKYDSGVGLWAHDRLIKGAVEFLCDKAAINKKVLDIGSGIGKFCILAAKLRPDFIFEGIELDKDRVEVSNLIAKEMKVKNVRFIKGDFRDLDVKEYGGFFIYSPFRMGAAYELNVTPYNWDYNKVMKYVDEMNQITAYKLASLPTGTKFCKLDGSHRIQVPEGFETERFWSNYTKK